MTGVFEALGEYKGLRKGSEQAISRPWAEKMPPFFVGLPPAGPEETFRGIVLPVPLYFPPIAHPALIFRYASLLFAR